MNRLREELGVAPRAGLAAAAAVALLIVLLFAVLFQAAPLAARLGFGVTMGLIVFVYGFLVAYVFGDARRRGMRHRVWALVAAFVPHALGLLLYFLLRAPLLVACPACGTAVRTLQEFLKTCDWSHPDVRDHVQTCLAHALARQPDDGCGTVGIVDENRAVKQGDKTPGVQRQYLGCVGKAQNGVVTVHRAVARGRFKALLDGELYRPRSWDDDRDRCAAAAIPADVVYRAKWRIALELLGRADGNGHRFDGVTFDEGYGASPSSWPRWTTPARGTSGRFRPPSRSAPVGRPRRWRPGTCSHDGT